MFEPVLKSLDKLNENEKSFYTEGEDGKFHLNPKMKKLIDKFNANEDLKGVVSKQSQQIKKLTDLLSKATAGTEDDEADIKIKKEDDLKLKKLSPEIKKLLESKDKQLKKTNDLLEKQEKLQKQLTLDNEISEAISKNNGIPELLKPILKQRVQIEKNLQTGVEQVVVKNEDGTSIINDKGAFMSVNNFVETLKTEAMYDRCFKSSEGKGAPFTKSNKTGATPNKSLKSMNETEKKNFITENGIEAFTKMVREHSLKVIEANKERLKNTHLQEIKNN